MAVTTVVCVALIMMLFTTTSALLQTQTASLISPRWKQVDVVSLRCGASFRRSDWPRTLRTLGFAVVGLQGLESYLKPAMMNHKKNGLESNPVSVYNQRRAGILKIACAILGTNHVKAPGISFLLLTIELARSLIQGDASKAGLAKYYDLPPLLLFSLAAFSCLIPSAHENALHMVILFVILLLVHHVGLFAFWFPKHYLWWHLGSNSEKFQNGCTMLSIRSLAATMVLYTVTLCQIYWGDTNINKHSNFLIFLVVKFHILFNRKSDS